MNASQLAALKSEIANDPQQLGYAALLPDQRGAVCDLLNAATQTRTGSLSAARALTWAASGPMAKIVDASNDAANPARASCLAFLQSLGSGMDIDMSNADVRNMFAGWLAAGLITQAQSDALYAKAAQACSRADVLNLPAVTVEDLYAAGV